MFDPAAIPFNLAAEDVAWVEATLTRLSPDQRIAQLFNVIVVGDDDAEIARLQAFGAGGVTRIMGGEAARYRAVIAGFQAQAPVPMLVSLDLEGSRMTVPGGTVLPNPLGLAAVDDIEATREVARITGAEAAALGINWSFTPVVDINHAFRSAIVATRGFGADPARIGRHALATIEGLRDCGIATAVKHWPGEGYDDRDQHLLTTINPLSVAGWEKTFGALYRSAIQAGVLSVMSAHVAFPSFVRSLHPGAGTEAAFCPATLSHDINQVLLRETLGFNGLIVSDATPMAGLGSHAHRRDYLPGVVAAGCDVILFQKDLDADFGYLKAVLADGRLGWNRVDEALRRQLAMKAALGLHRPKAPPRRDGTRDAARDGTRDGAFAKALHARVPTLVKDVAGLLPLSPQKHRRVLVFSTGVVLPFLPAPLPFALPEMLRAEGFEVVLHQAGQAVDPAAHDLILYLLGEETLLTRGRIFLDWAAISGGVLPAMDRHWHDLPTAMISFGYPYYLYDAPRVPTYINAYATTDEMQAAVVDALLGRSEWNRNSPVDPFCGLEDARI